MKKKTCKFIALLFLITGVCLFIAQPNSVYSASGNTVYVIQLDDATINPVTAEYITQSIDEAHVSGAQCLILKLDTPGGLLTSTRLIVKKILTAKVPVVVYISPSGSRAGSAGVFITYASNIAAMAPSTNIGAAHPVQMGGGDKKKDDSSNFWEELRKTLKESKEAQEKQKTGDDKKKDKSSKKDKFEDLKADDDPMSSKILQDTVAFIRAIATKRERNLEWAIKSVTESSSITETEAIDIGVVEIIAKDLNDLLSQLDGRVVKLDDGDVTLKTKDAVVKKVDMDYRQQFFNVLANPNIAYILMILGFYGLLYEITHPGIGVPGIMGFIFLILAFFSMQTLPTNYAGLALMILGLILLISEAVVPGFGLLTLGGLVCLILGSMLLFDSPVPVMRVSKSLIFSFALPTAGICFFLAGAVIKTHNRKVSSGHSAGEGDQGIAETHLKPGKEGKVFVSGSLWNAVSDEEIKKGDKIEVVKLVGMELTVKAFKGGK